MKSGLILLAFVITGSSCVYPGAWHMMNWGHMSYWTGGAIMFLILLLALIGVVVYFIINQKKMRKDYRKQENESVLEILKERYARGEITKQQYEDMKKALV